MILYGAMGYSPRIPSRRAFSLVHKTGNFRSWPLEAKAVLSVLSNSAVITSIIPCQKGSDKWDLTSGLAGSENRVLTNGV